MKSISLIKPDSVYLPEADAYQEYFSRHGFSCSIQSPDSFVESDISWHFMGIDPFFRPKSPQSFTIHEYGSLSIPPFPKLKDYLKKIINTKPDARVFLNRKIKECYDFSDKTQCFYRPMGVNKSFIEEGRRPHRADFDLVYCGSITTSREIDKALHYVSKSNLTILLIGSPEAEIYKNFKKFSNIHFAGRISREELPKTITLGRYGLNITPNTYPYQLQDSTKIIEYCALGLPVISTMHDWTINFADNNDASFYYIDDKYKKLASLTIEELKEIQFSIPDMKGYDWDSIISRSHIMKLLKEV